MTKDINPVVLSSAEQRRSSINVSETEQMVEEFLEQEILFKAKKIQDKRDSAIQKGTQDLQTGEIVNIDPSTHSQQPAQDTYLQQILTNEDDQLTKEIEEIKNSPKNSPMKHYSMKIEDERKLSIPTDPAIDETPSTLPIAPKNATNVSEPRAETPAKVDDVPKVDIQNIEEQQKLTKKRTSQADLSVVSMEIEPRVSARNEESNVLQIEIEPEIKPEKQVAFESKEETKDEPVREETKEEPVPIPPKPATPANQKNKPLEVIPQDQINFLQSPETEKVKP